MVDCTGHNLMTQVKSDWRQNKSSVNFHGCGWGGLGVLVDSRVGDISNHVGFVEVAAPRA
jgi:hypothetical protein